ncbi:MAG TPA: GH3 auxin-responsive promoter family protein [Ferruginibacter sp.]|nr:GH3 auxin-responsive promoter family protein [Ferruginibacter sp.]HRO16557.1 GH3 auxin-responsive promoter family protein [Ferruginibacter sp.]HRQ19934.1 GH3 auxin-responsive promoter family protein [Ferruginibacter sp.]
MKFKSFLAKPFANYIYRQIKKGMATAVPDQENLFHQLIKTASKTQFGKDHDFKSIKSHADYVQKVPIRDYEGFRPYIEMIKAGKHNVLWKGVPIYFAKTSGTTSGVKYIPITKDSIPNHINTARNALLCYMVDTGNTRFADGKLIFLSGSPVLERVGNIPTGRLSGIVNHHVPRYLRTNQLPGYETNCIEEWEEKLEKIVDETIQQRMTLISGIPPWVQMYFDKLIERTGQKVGTLFPDFSILVQGGVSFEPYRERLMESIGRPIDVVELFPASEGFFAFQDSQKHPGMLLNTNSGIFFEFVPLSEIHQPNPRRLTLAEVQLDEQYALIISSNAGLWAYNIGDTIKFVSLKPYRIVVTGRIKHFISAFGEHVIGEEVESAMLEANIDKISVTEFTVAPYVGKGNEGSYHEWLVEFDRLPDDAVLSALSDRLNTAMVNKNVYYKDLIDGNILKPLVITPIKKNGFVDYMRSIGKLGGQNKVPRLSNDRVLADALLAYKV